MKFRLQMSSLCMVLLSACSSLIPMDQKPAQCESGQTLLENVCVRQSVANYVSCIRAHGSELDSQTRQSLSAQASNFALSAQGASEVSTQLKRKYAVSEKAMLVIINQCQHLIAGEPSVVEYPQPKVDGIALDACQNWSEGCGQPAADRFCQLQGHKQALRYKIKNDAPPTMVITSGTLCDQAFCDRIDYVACK